MIDTEILEDYSSEARELLDEMDHSLMRLEKEGGVPELLNNIFRAVHCIKGSAQYIGLESSSTLTHGVENLLDRLREGLLPLDATVLDFLFRAKDLISTLIEEVAQTREEKSDISGAMEQLERILQRGSGAKAGSAPAAAEIPGETEEDLELSGLSASVLEPAPEGLAVSEPGDDVSLESAQEDILEEDELETTEELREYKASLQQSDDFDEEILGSEEESLYEPMSYVVREYDEESVEEGETSAFFTVTDTEEIRPESATGLSETEEHASADATAYPPEGTSQLSSDGALEGSVPQLLTLALYLDDFQDGFLHPGEIVPPFLETLDLLKESLEAAGIIEAADILEALRTRVAALETQTGEFSLQQIEGLRAYLYELRPHYPADIFPLGEREFPERAASVGAEFQEEETALSEAGAVPEVFPAVEQPPVSPPATPREVEPAEAPSPPATLTVPEGTEALPPSVTDAHREPTERAMMAGVDDELLSQFENEFESMFADRGGAGRQIRSDTPTVRSHQGVSDLAEGLDISAEDTDREIIEIFLDYGMEIMEKLGPLITNMAEGEITAGNLNTCADFINSIRSSATYMDYQKLASFLDDWYENTRAAGERWEGLSPIDLVFMSGNFERFQSFLRDLRRALYPEAPSSPILEAVVPRPAEAPHATPNTLPPASDEAVAKRPVFEAAASESEAVTAARQVATEPATETREPKGPHPSVAEREVNPDSVRVDGELKTEPAPAAPSPPVPPVVPDLPMARELGESAVVKTMRVDSAKVDTLLNQVGELVVNRSYVEQLSLELRHFHRGLMSVTQISKKEIQSIKDLAVKVGEASIALGRVATDIQEGVMKLRMLPVGQLFNRMPRLIRDLSRRVGKVVNLEVHGVDTEVDKRVIEQIYNPLVHLIRNAVDHGIEETEQRKKLGKSEEGLIILRAYSQGNQVNIDVEDDGMGIQRDVVLARAVEHHLIEALEAPNLSTQDVYNFLFFPGFSTSKAVTRTSGRGVGMDVVKKDVEKINGHVDIESWEGEGTRISIKIPLTLAIIQTLLIRSAKHVFAIPLTSVREIIQISAHEITTIEGFEVVKFRQETIPVLRISEVFNLKRPDPSKQPRFLVLATAGQRSVGFLVEELIGEQDVVIKPLADHVFKNRGLAGSTILGDGTIALVLDVFELIEDIISQQRQLAGQATRYVAAESQSQVTHSLDM